MPDFTKIKKTKKQKKTKQNKAKKQNKTKQKQNKTKQHIQVCINVKHLCKPTLIQKD